jgi:catechol-2,3-dioxygenase
VHLHHLAIQIHDLDATVRWYREVLELPVLREWRDDTGALRSVWLRLSGEAFLALERGPRRGDREQTANGEPGYHLAAFRISREERSHWERRLSERGVAIEHQTRWTIYLRDPEGNRIGLSHHPEE